MDQNLSADLTLNQDQDPKPNSPVDIKEINKKLRNILFSIVALVFVTVMFYSASTFAFFSDDVASGSNKITVGNFDVEVLELTDAGSGSIPYEDGLRIVPALSVSKIVKAKNSGSLPMQVRMKIEISIDFVDEATLPPNWRSLIQFDLNVDDESTTAVEGTWVYRDGYYYYLLPVESGKVTTPLFTSITFSPEMGNEFTNSEIKIKVICEASQVGVDAWPVNVIEND